MVILNKGYEFGVLSFIADVYNNNTEVFWMIEGETASYIYKLEDVHTNYRKEDKTTEEILHKMASKYIEDREADEGIAYMMDAVMEKSSNWNELRLMKKVFDEFHGDEASLLWKGFGINSVY